MNEGGQTVLPKFAGFEAEDEENGVDDVRLAVAIGADYTVEVGVEGAQHVFSVVGLEVDHLELMDDHGINIGVTPGSHSCITKGCYNPMIA